jgi:hypothetical protein
MPDSVGLGCDRNRKFCGKLRIHCALPCIHITQKSRFPKHEFPNPISKQRNLDDEPILSAQLDVVYSGSSGLSVSSGGRIMISCT